MSSVHNSRNRTFCSDFPITKITRRVTTFVLFAVVVVGSPILITVVLPLFYIIKFITCSALQILHPDLLRLVSGSSVTFCVDDLLGKPKFNAVAFIVLTGPIDLQLFRSTFQRQIIDKYIFVSTTSVSKKSQNRKLVYPELQKYWTSCFNYLFWKQDLNFHINNHIRLYDYEDGEDDPENVTSVNNDSDSDSDSDDGEENYIQNILGDLVSKSWKKEQSPWEILFIRKNKTILNLGEKKQKRDLLVFRFHHGLGDGYSFMKLIQDFLPSNSTESSGSVINNCLPRQINFPRYGPWENLIFKFIWPFRLPYDLAAFLVDSFDGPNCWHKFWKPMSREYYTSFTGNIPTVVIKRIKNKYGVSYNDVLCSASCGTIRRLMVDAGQIVPSEISSVFPVPVPGHSLEGLVNQMSMVCARWPIGLDISNVERLRLISQRMKISKFTITPLASQLLKDVMGTVLPNFLIQLMQSLFMSTMGISSFPGPEEPLEAFGSKVDNIMLAAALGMGKVGACVILFSTGGNQRCFAAIDRSIFPSQEIFNKFRVYMKEEIYSLLENDG